MVTKVQIRERPRDEHRKEARDGDAACAEEPIGPRPRVARTGVVNQYADVHAARSGGGERVDEPAP